MSFTNFYKFAFILLMFGYWPLCQANDYTPGNKHFETCLAEVMKIKSGFVIKVEMKQEENKLIYEFDVRDEDNMDWDIECDANTADIVEIEEEVFSPQDQKFAKNMKFDLKAAKSIALESYPGEIIEIEYEIENDGLAVYEFDIKTDKGEEIKLEINASTGAIHEKALELWQIGYE